MAFNMKGSPAKLGTIKGTAGHKSALKMAAEAEAAQNSPAPFIGALVGGAVKKAAGSLVKKGAKAVGKKIAGSKIGKKVAGSKIGKALGIGGGQQPEGPESPAKLDTKIGRAPRKKKADFKKEAKKKVEAIEGGGKWEGGGGGLKIDKKKPSKKMDKRMRKLDRKVPSDPRPRKKAGELTKEELWKRSNESMKETFKPSPRDPKKDRGGLKVDKKKRSLRTEGPGGDPESPNKWLLTAAKAVGKGLMGRSKQKDARDAAIHKGVSSAMSRPIQYRTKTKK